MIYINISLPPKPVEIVDEECLKNIPSSFALVRLKNKKLALMTRSASDNTLWEPFYVRGIETGFWDSARIGELDYELVCKDYALLGANTMLFMVHWKDIEPSDGCFDFSYCDKMVKTAKKHGLKLWFVLFTHNHGYPDEPLDFWGYHLDETETHNPSVMWIGSGEGEVFSTIEGIKKHTEIFPCYANPKIFERIKRLCYEIGKHYHLSDTVIGVQIGNEECYPYCNQPGWDTDYNPHSLALYEEWKRTTGKTSRLSFKLWSSKWWWKQFTTAFHERAPYLLTSYNLGGGCPEAGFTDWIHKTGSDATIYGEANIDTVAPMFYFRLAPRIWENLDMHYDYLYRLPILIPSEIGIGGSTYFVSEIQYMYHLLYTLERGAQGYCAYCYGNIMEEMGKTNPCGQAVAKLNKMVSYCEDILWSGLPGWDELDLSTDAKDAKISGVSSGEKGCVGLLYFPEYYPEKDVPPSEETCCISLEIRSSNEGLYCVDVLYEGELILREEQTIGKAPYHCPLKDIKKTAAVFVKITRLSK